MHNEVTDAYKTVLMLVPIKYYIPHDIKITKNVLLFPCVTKKRFVKFRQQQRHGTRVRKLQVANRES